MAGGLSVTTPGLEHLDPRVGKAEERGRLSTWGSRAQLRKPELAQRARAPCAPLHKTTLSLELHTRYRPFPYMVSDVKAPRQMPVPWQIALAVVSGDRQDLCSNENRPKSAMCGSELNRAMGDCSPCRDNAY